MADPKETSGAVQDEAAVPPTSPSGAAGAVTFKAQPRSTAPPKPRSPARPQATTAKARSPAAAPARPEPHSAPGGPEPLPGIAGVDRADPLHRGRRVWPD